MSDIALARRPNRGAALLVVAATLCHCPGCDDATKSARPEQTGSGVSDADASIDGGAARGVLDAMARAYSTATTYADGGAVRLRYKQGEYQFDESVDFAVTFERPNRVRLNIYKATVACDGDRFHAAIADLEGEVLQVPAPEQLTLEEIYRHELLGGILTGTLAGPSPQLTFLLNPDALGEIVRQSTASPELLTPAKVDDQPCDRVLLPQSDGRMVMWIDQKSHELRRVEYPVDALATQLGGTGAVSDLSLVADFSGARLNQPVDPVAFQFETPADAKIVSSFVRRVETSRPEPPSELLGRQVSEFTLYTLAGERVTSESMAGKIVVLDFWFTTCAPCQAAMPLVDRVFQKYAHDERVRFYAVSIADPEGGNLELQRTLHDWRVSLPILRDVDQVHEGAFAIPGAPALFVIGADGRVQDQFVGLDPQLAEELEETLAKLLNGQDTHDQPRRRYEARLAAFQQAQAETSGTVAGTAVSRAEIAPRTEPMHFTLQRLWSMTSLKEPGNVTAFVDADGKVHVDVIDGWRQVVELDEKGQLVERHLLDLPEGAVIKYLRTAADRDGKRYFAGSASAQQQVHLFDGKWKRLGSFPDAAAGKHDGITDVQLADLDGDGACELAVGFWGAGGVQCLALDGTPRWRSAALELVYKLAVGDADDSNRRGLWATNRDGTLVPLNHDGEEQPPLALGASYFHAVYTADLNGDGRQEMCAVARDQSDRESLVGVTVQGTAAWDYQLPLGLQQYSIEPITGGRLSPDEPGCWIVAGADGSIQFIGADGNLRDRYHHGAALAGLALVEIDGKPALLIASANAVEAWQVTAR